MDQFFFIVARIETPAQKSRLLQSVAHLLRAGIILRSADVNEQSVLLHGEHLVIDQPRKNVGFQTSRSLRKVLENRRAKDVYAGVNHPGRDSSSFFRKARHSTACIDLDGSVAARVLDLVDSQGSYSTMLAMKLQQLREIDFEK